MHGRKGLEIRMHEMRCGPRRLRGACGDQSQPLADHADSLQGEQRLVLEDHADQILPGKVGRRDHRFDTVDGTRRGEAQAHDASRRDRRHGHGRVQHPGHREIGHVARAARDLGPGIGSLVVTAKRVVAGGLLEVRSLTPSVMVRLFARRALESFEHLDIPGAAAEVAGEQACAFLGVARATRERRGAGNGQARRAKPALHAPMRHERLLKRVQRA